MEDFLRDNWSVILVVGVMVVGYLLLRTPGDEMASTEAFDVQVSSGTPTLVQFFSNT